MKSFPCPAIFSAGGGAQVNRAIWIKLGGPPEIVLLGYVNSSAVRLKPLPPPY